MAHKHRKRCYISSYDNRETKQQGEHHYIPMAKAKIQNTNSTKCWLAGGATGPLSYLLLGIQNGTATLEGSLKVSQKTKHAGASLVIWGSRIYLPARGTWDGCLAWEDPTCHRIGNPVHRNFWALALVHASHTYWSRTTEGHVPRAHAHKRNHSNEKPMHRSEEQALLTANRERPHVAIKTQHSQKNPQRLRTLLSYDPLPGVYPKELKAYVHTKTCT